MCTFFSKESRSKHNSSSSEINKFKGSELNNSSIKEHYIECAKTNNKHIYQFFTGDQCTKKVADFTMRMPVFHGYGIEDLDQILFVCEAVWTVNKVQYYPSKIS